MEDAEENINIALKQLLIEEDELKYKILEICPKNRFQKFSEQLASSPFKLVFRAYDAEQGKEVLWNTIKARRIPKKQLGRIYTQLTLLKQISHNHIVKCHDHWIKIQHREIVFITEIMNGGCLRDYIDKIKTTKLKVVKNWCQQILKGIAYLHEHQKPIIHQNIRCSNIYINSTTNEVKLGQLGLLFTPSSPFQSLTGYHEWTAPQFFTNSHLGTPSDIYSFGMTLLQLITGTKPYSQCRNHADLYHSLDKGIKPQSIKQVCYPELKQIIQACISHVPSDRPTAKELLLHPFWKPNQQIDNENLKTLPNLQRGGKNGVKNQRAQKEVKLSQNVTELQSDIKIKYIFDFKTNKKYEFCIWKQNDEQFQQFRNFLVRRLQDKNSQKQSTNQLIGCSNKFQSRDTVKDDHTYLLSYNNPTMKTMRFDQFYESRVKEDDYKKFTTNISELNELGQTDVLSRVQQVFAAMYEAYKNKIQIYNIDESFQEARFLIERKELDDLQCIEKEKAKLNKKNSKGDKAFLANSINFDFLNNSEAAWPNDIYDVEKDISLKNALPSHPQDVLCLNFSLIQNNRQETHPDFQLQNARYILNDQDGVGNNLNKSFLLDKLGEGVNGKKGYLQLIQESQQKQEQKMVESQQQQIKGMKQLFEKKLSTKKKVQQGLVQSKCEVLM